MSDSGTAPPDNREQFQHEGNAMSDDRYDQLSTDKESLRQWEADANIRQEFLGDYEPAWQCATDGDG